MLYAHGKGALFKLFVVTSSEIFGLKRRLLVNGWFTGGR